MERRTVQMALMRMGVSSSATPQVGAMCSWATLCQGFWLLPSGVFGTGSW